MEFLEGLSSFFARSHLLLVHFPLGLSLFFLIFLLLPKKVKAQIYLGPMERKFYLGLIFTVVLALQTGTYLDLHLSIKKDGLKSHQFLAWLSLLILFIGPALQRKFVHGKIVALTLASLILLLCGIQGHVVGKGLQWESFSFLKNQDKGQFTVKKPSSKRTYFLHPQFVSFHDKVRPILSRHCLTCHGERKAEKGLRLDEIETFMSSHYHRGLIVPRNKEKSLIYQSLVAPSGAVQHMPYGKGLISEEEIEIIGQWIDQGAFDFPEFILEKSDSQKKADSWVYKDFTKPKTPHSINPKLKNPVDFFVEKELAKYDLELAPQASLQVLLKRLAYDLWGLPPSPDVYQKWAGESEEYKYQKAIEYFLGEKDFGERWALYWMDLVRYADSAGYDLDRFRPWAFHYRDFLIKSFNEDLSYQKFIRVQTAGDVLDFHYPNARVATGFLLIGPAKDAGPRSPLIDYAEWDERMTSTMQVTLGLEMKCARCHDHKEEPITQSDYYSLLLPFKTLGPSIEDPFQYLNKEAELKIRLAMQKKRFEEEVVKLRPKAYIQSAITLKEEDTMPIAVGGNPERKGAIVSFQLPRQFAYSKYDYNFWKEYLWENWTAYTSRSSWPQNGKQRAAMALWLTDPQKGVGKHLARVMVDHVWRKLFGQGLIGPAAHWGVNLAPPPHLDLLNWLAYEFIENGWSVKHLIKIILRSRTYQQSGLGLSAECKNAPLNLFCGRRPRPLEAESIRDAIMKLSGKLNTTYLGPSVTPHVEKDLKVETTESDWYEHWPYKSDDFRKSIYVYRKRSFTFPAFKVLNGANYSGPTLERSETFTSAQALFFLNSEFLKYHSLLVVSQFLKNKKLGSQKTAINIFKHILGRDPTKEEWRTLEKVFHHGDYNKENLLAFTKALFSSNEFLHVE